MYVIQLMICNDHLINRFDDVLLIYIPLRLHVQIAVIKC